MATENPESVATYELIVHAEGFQIYVQDERTEAELSDAWDEESQIAMLALRERQASIATVRDFEVPVSVEILPGSPDDTDLDDWDHVVECSLEIPSGRLVVSGPTEDFFQAKRIPLEPGNYGMRVYFGALDDVDDEGFEGDDFYRIVIWPDSPKERKVLKQWIPAPPTP